MKHYILTDLEKLEYLTEEDLLAIEIMKKTATTKKIKELHPYRIYHSEKSGWMTTVDDANYPGGKKKIHRTSEESLMNALIEIYTQKNINLEDIFPEWIEQKKESVKQSTLKRFLASWNSYYLNEPLSQDILKTPLSNLTSLQLRDWADKILKKHQPVDEKKFDRIFSIIKGCFEYACDEDINIIRENTWLKAKKKLNKSLVKSKARPSSNTQIFTAEERRRLTEMVYQDMAHYSKQASSAGLQILLLFETGLRIGEACGLKWDDIDKTGNYLTVNRQADNDGERMWTKTASGKRRIPLTKRAKTILSEIRAFNEAHNYDKEWIFQNGSPKYDYRLGCHAADRKLRKLCNRLGTPFKSPHKCRKTFLSCLLNSHKFSDTYIQEVAGHEDILTTLQYYCYEMKDTSELIEAMEEALSF